MEKDSIECVSENFRASVRAFRECVTHIETLLEDPRFLNCVELKQLQSLSPLLPSRDTPVVDRPSWDREARQLSWNGVLVREVKRPNQACNIVSILDAFEAKGWPPRIDDPLQRASSDPNRRRDVENLNKRILRPVLRFACDGTGTGFLWRSHR